MADADRDVTREELDGLADKLAPALESLTDGEREIFGLILERATAADSDVSGFGQHWKLGDLRTGIASPDSILSGQLGAAAGLAAMKKFTDIK